MKASFRVKPTLLVEIESETESQLWKDLASLQEVFGESKCGKCGCEDLKMIVRTVDENEYFELRCTKCFARLSYGQHKKGGGLFPKRKDGENNYLPNGGWVK